MPYRIHATTTGADGALTVIVERADLALLKAAELIEIGYTVLVLDIDGQIVDQAQLEIEAASPSKSI